MTSGRAAAGSWQILYRGKTRLPVQHFMSDGMEIRESVRLSLKISALMACILQMMGQERMALKIPIKMGKRVYIASPHDSFRFTGMGLIYLEHGILAYHADAMSVHGNFIAECGNCIELRGSG